MNQGAYDFRRIEDKWRQHWLQNKTFKTLGPGDEGFDPEAPKCYILDMFPYPSGSGLHIGHPKGYIASDIYSRYKRMQGFNVLHPMGFDSFGLPAEQYAIENNVHPAIVTEENIAAIRKQLEFLGLSYDWDRELVTSREDYYRWTQWIFLQLFDSYFDPDYTWEDQAGRTLQGKACTIAELIAALDQGQYALSPADREVGGGGEWAHMDPAQRAAVLNNYRLVYQRQVTVNWCPGLGTVLSNEEVTVEGKSERGDFPVFQRPLKQWIMRITDYGDRLLADLDDENLPDGCKGTFKLDWPEAVKIMQRNWIGRSPGAEVQFTVKQGDTGPELGEITVFTTRPDTLFGATFMVVAPQHPLLQAENLAAAWPDDTDPRWKGANSQLGLAQAVAAYQDWAAGQTAAHDEQREKTGVFTGLTAINPVNGSSIPVFVADYVSMDYGSGAIMAVPAHDDRDHEFAQALGLPIIEVVQKPADFAEGCYSGQGISINSPAQGNSPFAITGLETVQAQERIVEALEQQGLGRATVNYKLRDWIFSRQRYWGEPMPLASGKDGTVEPVDIPVTLPPMDDFRPATSTDPKAPVAPPLSRAPAQWRQLDFEGRSLTRELNVMPQWAGSCWYYLRFIDPSNENGFCEPEKEQWFMPVDLYIGGAEHAVLHLLYARFWHKALFDLGHVSTPEPFKKLFNQGMITADAFADSRGTYIDIRQVEIRQGEGYHRQSGEKLQRFSGKMGKRYKNGLPPEEVGEEYGVDTLRLYEMYMGPLEASTPWSMEGIRGMQRFLQRLWRNLVAQDGTAQLGGEATPQLQRLLHQTILRVGEDIEHLRINTAIAGLIEFNNQLVSLERVPSEIARQFILLLAPLAPHIAAEIWTICGWAQESIEEAGWPRGDQELAREETVVLPIQVNGKMRGKIEVPVGIEEADLKEQVWALDTVKHHVPDPGAVKRFIVVPGRIVNIVV
ncbi:MAG: leucine--tRNA ligase [Candidatus Latescibacteria bacterium]|nr:leucine--tRNA ligase [Candidatus Latescibacterota bacterium]